MSLEKINAAKGALEFVKDGMTIGLGSGSTVKEFIKLLGEKIKKEDINIECVTTSLESRMLAIENGIEIKEPYNIKKIDLAVDGADKVSEKGLLKGGGGALTREKIIDYNSSKFVVIVDEKKIIRGAKLRGKVTLEVLEFAVPFVMEKLREYSPKVRMAEKKLGPVVSDNGSIIIDFEAEIDNPKKMEEMLNLIPGIIENGIFTRFNEIVVGTDSRSYILKW